MEYYKNLNIEDLEKIIDKKLKELSDKIGDRKFVLYGGSNLNKDDV